MRVAVGMVVVLLLAGWLAGCTQGATDGVKPTPTSTGPRITSTGGTSVRPTQGQTVTTAPAPSKPTLDGNVPELSVGDWFLRHETSPNDDDFTYNETVVDIGPLTLQGQTFDAIHFETVIHVYGVNVTTETWLRVGDLAVLRHRQGTALHDPNARYVEHTQIPPCDGKYPIRSPDYYTRHCVDHARGISPDGSSDQDSYSEVNATYRVTGTEVVKVPAGSFNSYRIESGPAGYPDATAVEWVSSHTCGQVRYESNTDAGTEVHELLAFHCAKAR